MDKWNDQDMMPMWMKMTMILCKWAICILPFVICSILFILKSEMTMWDNWILTCVYLLSLANIIHIVDEKF